MKAVCFRRWCARAHVIWFDHQDKASDLQNKPIHGSSHLCAYRESTMMFERDSYRCVRVLFWMLLYPRSIIIIIIPTACSGSSPLKEHVRMRRTPEDATSQNAHNVSTKSTNKNAPIRSLVWYRRLKQKRDAWPLTVNPFSTVYFHFMLKILFYLY